MTVRSHKNKTAQPILLAEDENDMRVIIQEALEDAGYKVVAAENGDDAMKFLLKKKFSCAILDARMPKMGGLEALEKIHELPSPKKLPPIIIFTNFSRHE